MNIKSLLIGSAAALAAVSGAQAADAIVAAEPEPMEYVRVCDAFGTGFFYIPGTETCLKIGGFVRFQTSFGRDEIGDVFQGKDNDRSDWDAHTLVDINLDARSDTELGTLRGFVNIEAASGGKNRSIGLTEDVSVNYGRSDNSFFIDEAFIELGGFKVGRFYSWWDSGINGENDSLGNETNFDSIAYTYDGGTWRAGISLDELSGRWSQDEVTDALGGIPVTLPLLGTHHDLGVAATVGFSLGGVNLDVLGGYDGWADEGAIRAILSADVGPGTFQLAGIWASDPNAYWVASEWTVAASYAFKATEKLTITPAAQYFGDLGFDSDADMWRVGLTVGYQVVEGLDLLATVDYNNVDVSGAADEDFTRGFLRLQRNF
ncbi:porin [Shinella zoogloeoides]|uniref:Porin n=1 Tax=Shinella zoogloeoides TaxID=352475 RepID=A0A6N8TQ19_SHIZO|nr:porin [Shinella zoogloeoides]MXO03150.1 porin [Shinella zoogloeoides]UEX82622.1 porin [Shinella zoogloeoides]UEX82623.1 porin [Shinella zoogloeoides]